MKARYREWREEGRGLAWDERLRRAAPKPLRRLAVPIFFDAVEDGVRLRSLAAVTFVVLFAAILTLLLGYVFRDPLQLLGDQQVWSNQMVLPPPGEGQFGVPFRAETLLRVVNFKGNGVEDAEVTVAIQRVRAPLLGLDIDCTTLAPTLLNLQFRFVCDTNITGNVAKSGSAGFALVSDTTIATGLVGTYNLSYTSESVSSYAVVTMHSQVLAVRLVGQVPRSVAVGEEISFGVQVFDEAGLPVEGRSIVMTAASLAPGDLENMGVNYVPDYRADKFGIIENLGDERTNSSGMAQVRMIWKAANYAYQYPIIICERAKLLLFPSFYQPMIITTNVNVVRIVEEPPQTIEELTPFSAVIGVFDANGQPLQGKFVMAEISLYAGGREPPYMSVPRSNPLKKLYHALSTPSDEEGLARFTNLTFNQEGPAGAYRITFFCDGVSSNESITINVTTAVRTVIAIWETQGINIAVGQEITTMPSVYVLDKEGLPLQGKTISGYHFNQSNVRLIGTPAESLGNGIATFYDLMILQGRSNQALALTLSVDGVGSRLPVDLQLAQFNEDPNGCSYIQMTSLPQLPLVVGQSAEAVVQAVNYAYQPVSGVIAEVDGQFQIFGLGATNATGYATFSNMTIGAGFTQVVTFAVIGFQTNSSCIGDLLSMQLINPVASVRLTSVAPDGLNNTSADYLVEYEALDAEERPLPVGLKAEVVLLASPAYLQFSESPLFNCTQLHNQSVVLLSLNKGHPGEYLFALKVAGEPGPIFNITLSSDVATLQIVTQPGVDPTTDVARLGVPFAVQPVIRVLDEGGNGVAGVVIESYVCSQGGQAFVGSVDNTDSNAGSPYSAASDSLGNAHFSSLGFVGASPGTYSLCFAFARGETFQVGPVGPSTALKSVDTMHVVVVQQPSATASVGVPVAVPPTVQVYAIRAPVGVANTTSALSLSAESATNLSPRHLASLNAIYSASNDLTTAEELPNGRQLLTVMIGVVALDGVLTKNGVLTNTLATTTNGNLTFSQLTFQFGLQGYAFLVASVVGGATTSLLDINPVQIVDIPSRIAVQQGPPASVYVGQSFYVAVVVTIGSGSPLADHMVQAVLDKMPPNSYASLDETTSFNTTDVKGFARFHLILSSGIPGNYSLRFRSASGGVISDSTATFRVLNIVEQVEVLTQPTGEALISENQKRAIDSMRQPRLRIVDVEGKGLPGRTLDVLTIPSDGALRYNHSHLSDDNGYYQFTDLHFIDGTSQSYSFVFVCEGIAVQSQSFDVYNELEPDQSNLKYLSYIVYVSMAIVLPIFFANSGWVRQRYAAFGFMIVGLLLILGMIGVAIGIVTNGYRGGQLDPYLQTIRIFLIVILLLPVVPYIIVFSFFLLKKTQFFHYRARKEMFHRHTRKLLQSPATLGIPLSLAAKEAAVRQREEFLKSLGWKKRLWVTLRNLPKDFENWHAPLESRDSFFYPQRFVIGISLSLTILFYVFVGAMVMIYYVIYLLVKSYNLLIAFEVAALQKGQGLGNNEIFGDLWAALVSLLVRVSISIDTHIITSLRTQIFATGLSAALFSLFVCIIVLVHYCRSYRQEIMRMRQGIYPESRDDYGLPGATSFIGTVMNHTAAGFLAIFVLLWIVLFLVANDVFRMLIWDELVKSWLLQKFLTASFIISISLFLFRFLVVGRILLGPQGAIRHRRWFAAADYVNTFLSALGGLISVAIRLVTAAGFMLVSFVRLDTPAIGSYSSKDPGYSSWIGLLVSDARYNNPVANVFADLMIEKLVQLRQDRRKAPSRTGKETDTLFEPVNDSDSHSLRLERVGMSDSDSEFEEPYGKGEEDRQEGLDDDEEEEEKGAIKQEIDRRTRARNRWFLFYTLIKNPQLRMLRRRAPERGPSNPLAYEEPIM